MATHLDQFKAMLIDAGMPFIEKVDATYTDYRNGTLYSPVEYRGNTLIRSNPVDFYFDADGRILAVVGDTLEWVRISGR